MTESIAWKAMMASALDFPRYISDTASIFWLSEREDRFYSIRKLSSVLINCFYLMYRLQLILLDFAQP